LCLYLGVRGEPRWGLLPTITVCIIAVLHNRLSDSSPRVSTALVVATVVGLLATALAFDWTRSGILASPDLALLGLLCTTRAGLRRRPAKDGKVFDQQERALLIGGALGAATFELLAQRSNVSVAVAIGWGAAAGLLATGVIVPRTGRLLNAAISLTALAFAAFILGERRSDALFALSVACCAAIFAATTMLSTPVQLPSSGRSEQQEVISS